MEPDGMPEWTLRREYPFATSHCCLAYYSCKCNYQCMPRLILEQFLPSRLNRLAMDISQRLRVVYGAKYGLTVPEWRVLATIGQYGEITAKQVGLIQHCTKLK